MNRRFDSMDIHRQMRIARARAIRAMVLKAWRGLRLWWRHNQVVMQLREAA